MTNKIIINSDRHYTVLWSHNRTWSRLDPGKISLRKRWLHWEMQGEWEAMRQRRKKSILNSLQHVPKLYCNRLLPRSKRYWFTFLHETSKNNTNKLHLKIIFKTGLQGMKDNDSWNKWSYPNEGASSLPRENFQATPQGEETEIESTRLPTLGDEADEGLVKPKQREIRGQNTGEKTAKQKKDPGDLQRAFSWERNHAYMWGNHPRPGEKTTSENGRGNSAWCLRNTKE